MGIIECLKESMAWKYCAVVFFVVVILAFCGLKTEKGKYFYGRWLGHKMAIRIGLSVALSLLLLAVPFAFIGYNSISLQEEEIAGGLIQSVGTIITGIGVVAAYVLQSDENNRQNTLKYTTESRSKWMDDGRQLTSELCEVISEYFSAFSGIPDQKKISETFVKISRLIPSLYMRFNFNGARDRVLLVLLDRINEKVLLVQQEFEASCKLPTTETKEEISSLLKLFVLHLQIYYKVEWERLKMEVKYVGNVEARDYYIKEKMVDLRNMYYKNQAIREQTLFPDGIPYNVIDLSVITVYLKLIGAELKISEQLKIRYAKEIELEQRKKIIDLSIINWSIKSNTSDKNKEKVTDKDIDVFENDVDKEQKRKLKEIFSNESKEDIKNAVYMKQKIKIEKIFPNEDISNMQRIKIRLLAHEILKW